MTYCKDDVVVSICCLTFNHVKYIRKCLEGFISQKTSFKFEVIIHDDASTDGTTAIVKEFEEKYPDIIKPIYQTENQYSKGVKILKNNVFPRTTGKYVAFCEGDDYWCDEEKLQRQVEAMECHPECSICTHYVHQYEIERNRFGGYCPSKSFNLKNGIVDTRLQSKIMLTSFMQLSSYLVRRDLFDEYLNNPPEYLQFFPTGDIAVLAFFSKNGSLYFIDKVMSVYNHGTEGSWTMRVASKKDSLIQHCNKTIDAFTKLQSSPYLDEYEKELIETRIRKEEWRILSLEEKYKEKLSKRYKFIYKKMPIKSKVKIIVGAILPSVVRAFEHQERRNYE